jgi:hypothetical protein
MKENEERVEEVEEVTEERLEEETAASKEETQDEVITEGNVGEAETKTAEISETEESAETLSHDDPLDEDAIEQIDNLKKHDAAILLIKKTKHMVDDTEKQLDACKLLLQEDLKSYDEAKASLKEHALEESEALLEELGYDKEEDTFEEDEVVFEAKEEIPPFYVRDVSSGKFSSFLLALIGGLVTFAGLTYFATEKVGVTLDVTKVPSHEVATKVFGWYATLFGGKPDLFMGGAFVLIVTLFVMGLIYGIRVASRASRNLSFAKQQLEEAQEYAKHKGSCKEEMDKVDAHMNEAIKILKTYEIILNEQNGKLKRILHIEGVKEEPSEYHEKSQREIEDTSTLVNTIKNFMGTSMSEEGKLSGKSTMFLHSAKSKLQKFLDRHY